MTRKLPKLTWLTLLAAVLAGCGYGGAAQWHFDSPQDTAHYDAVARQIEYPNVGPSCDDTALGTQSPDVVGRDGQIQFLDMTLEEAVQSCLQHSKVMSDLGGSVLRFPDRAPTIMGPSIAETDPQYGVDAALSQYDAVFNYKYDAQHNDRLLNNVFFGGGTRDLKQDLDTFNAELDKATPTGTSFAFRNNTIYDHNNEPGNVFPGAWDTNFEASVRQHLLQGAGTEYNNIVGPNGSPGQYNGVLIARINTDVALTEFEKGMRDLISNVENAYWDLYFAYRDLDAKVAARDNALESWRRTHALFLAGRRGGEAEKEAAAREQYFQFQEEVENAWSGRLVDGTQTNNGSSGGTLRSNGGVRVAERRLRRLLGLPISDGRLIRPADEPSMARLVFNWDEVLPEALSRREELREQRWMVKRQELVLIASKSFLLPTLDGFGTYRWRGFGRDLIGPDTDDLSRSERPDQRPASGMGDGSRLVDAARRAEGTCYGSQRPVGAGPRARSARRSRTARGARPEQRAGGTRSSVSSGPDGIQPPHGRPRGSRGDQGRVRGRQGAARSLFGSPTPPSRCREPVLRRLGGIRTGDQKCALRKGLAAGLRRSLSGRGRLARQGLRRCGEAPAGSLEPDRLHDEARPPQRRTGGTESGAAGNGFAARVIRTVAAANTKCRSAAAGRSICRCRASGAVPAADPARAPQSAAAADARCRSMHPTCQPTAAFNSPTCGHAPINGR